MRLTFFGSPLFSGPSTLLGLTLQQSCKLSSKILWSQPDFLKLTSIYMTLTASLEASSLMMLTHKKFLTLEKTSRMVATTIWIALERVAAGLKSSLLTASSCSLPLVAPWWFSADLTTLSADAAPLGFCLLSVSLTSVSSSLRPFGDSDLLASFALWTSLLLTKETWKMKLEIAGPMRRMDSSSSLFGSCSCSDVAAAASKVSTCPSPSLPWSEITFPKFERINHQLHIDTRC